MARNVLRNFATGALALSQFLFAGAAIMVETAVGFLGFGKAPPAPSWGNLVADASQAINNHPWLLVPTGGTIMLTVLSLGLLGDAVRDLAVDRQAPSTRTAPSRTSLVADAPSDGRAAIMGSASGLLVCCAMKSGARVHASGSAAATGTGFPVSPRSISGATEAT
mgnify:CR=1 FL=1